jgi:hypothetical protein
MSTGNHAFPCLYACPCEKKKKILCACPKRINLLQKTLGPSPLGFTNIFERKFPQSGYILYQHW